MPVRTTIVLDDEMMDRLRHMAASRRTGLSRVISDVLRAGPKQQGRGSDPPYHLAWKTVRGRLIPGVDINDRDRLYDVMEGRS